MFYDWWNFESYSRQFLWKAIQNSKAMRVGSQISQFTCEVPTKKERMASPPPSRFDSAHVKDQQSFVQLYLPDTPLSITPQSRKHEDRELKVPCPPAQENSYTADALNKMSVDNLPRLPLDLDGENITPERKTLKMKRHYFGSDSDGCSEEIILRYKPRFSPFKCARMNYNNTHHSETVQGDESCLLCHREFVHTKGMNKGN
jgi:hypothetical protein